MNTTEILMQYVAGQMAQSYFPQVNNNVSQSGQSDFQTMLKEKQNQSQNTVQQNKPASSEKQEAPQKEQSTQQTTQDGQQMQQLQQMQQMQQVLSGQLLMGEAALASGQIQPMQQMMQNMADSVNGESQMAVATAVGATVDTQNVVPQQVVQPMAQTEGDATQAEGFQLPQQQVNQTQNTQQTVDTVQTTMQDIAQMAEGEQTQAPMQDTDVTVETVPQDVQQPLFSETESMPVKVGDAPVLDTTVQPEEMDTNLSKIINDAMNQNLQRVELRLNPENLGNVVVELTRSPEGMLHVVLHADNQNAAKLLSEHSANLSLMLQNSNATEVRVEVPQSQQSQQMWQQPDQNGGQQQQQQQQQPRQQQNAEDFLHQIRLGLLGMEVEQA